MHDLGHLALCKLPALPPGADRRDMDVMHLPTGSLLELAVTAARPPRSDRAGDLARLVSLLAQKTLIAPVELEAGWHNVGHAIDALLKPTI